jgi:hypothetical protein
VTSRLAERQKHAQLRQAFVIADMLTDILA